MNHVARFAQFASGVRVGKRLVFDAVRGCDGFRVVLTARANLPRICYVTMGFDRLIPWVLGSESGVKDTVLFVHDTPAPIVVFEGFSLLCSGGTVK